MLYIQKENNSLVSSRRVSALACLCLLWLFAAGVFARADDKPIATAVAAERFSETLPGILSSVPHIQQKPDFCGEACIAMWMQALGYPASQDWVYDLSGLDPLRNEKDARGCYPDGLIRAARAIGFKTGPCRIRIVSTNPRGSIRDAFTDMLADLEQGIPSIVCMRFDNRPNTTDHFRLILGYNADRREIIYHEPAFKNGAFYRMHVNDFYSLWPCKLERGRNLIRIRLEPGQNLKMPTASTGATNADYTQAIMAAKSYIKQTDFKMLCIPPFLVCGDEDLSKLQNRALGTIDQFGARIMSAFFNRNSLPVFHIWICKDSKSYRLQTSRLLRISNPPEGGVLSFSNRLLVADASCMEDFLPVGMARLLLHARLPNAPLWLSTGFGLCFQQQDYFCSWRNPALVPPFPSFEKFCHTTTPNPAQAGLLCQYLNASGLLCSYLRLLENQGLQRDPSGAASLQSVLGPDGQKSLQAWISSQRVSEDIAARTVSFSPNP